MRVNLASRRTSGIFTLGNGSIRGCGSRTTRTGGSIASLHSRLARHSGSVRSLGGGTNSTSSLGAGLSALRGGCSASATRFRDGLSTHSCTSTMHTNVATGNVGFASGTTRGTFVTSLATGGLRVGSNALANFSSCYGGRRRSSPTTFRDRGPTPAFTGPVRGPTPRAMDTTNLTTRQCSTRFTPGKGRWVACKRLYGRD